nr:MFS transporter [Nocardiopsis ansamitocini]
MRRARRTVWAYFFVAGMIIATWAARIPAVKEQAGLNDGQLSLALLGLAVGALAAMQVAGRLVDRHGSTATILPAAVIGSLALVAPGYANSLPFLFVALFAIGAGHGMIDVPINVHAARVERLYGRPIMASFHAAFSIGGFTGAALGGLAAYARMSAALTFWIVALVLVVLSVAVRRGLLGGLDSTAPAPVRGDQDPTSPKPGGRARISPKVVFFGLVALCCMLAEGSATDWATVFLHDQRGASGALAAAGFAAFSALMAAGRLVGDRLTARFGPVAIVRAGGLLGACGLTLSLVAPWTFASIVGFAIMGAGLSCIIPQVFTAAVDYDPARAGRNLGFVAAIGYVGLLSGPVAIGALAHVTNLTVAMAVPAVLSVFIALAAVALRPDREGSVHPVDA